MSNDRSLEPALARLVESLVPADDRARVTALLKQLRTSHPHETPAAIFQRARREGAPIPPSRCGHGVTRGECRACDPRIGERFYFTGGGTHVHTRPTCEALASGQDEVARRGGTPDPIEVVRVYATLDGRDPCKRCFTTRAPVARVSSPGTKGQSRRPAKAATAPSAKVFSRLEAENPPAIGRRIEWGGYIGDVVGVNGRGVSFSIDGMTMTAPWGEQVVMTRADT